MGWGLPDIGGVVDSVFPGAGSVIDAGGDLLDQVTGQAAADAQGDAARRILEGIEEAKGVITPMYDRATDFIGQGTRDAMGTLRLRYGAAADQLKPLLEQYGDVYDMGMTGLEDYARASTPLGFASNLQMLSDQNGALSPLYDERRESVEQALAARGIDRSGGGIREIANIDTDTLLGLENTLTGRSAQMGNMVLPSLAGLTGIRGTLGSLQTGLGTNIANLSTERAANLANLLGEESTLLANLATQSGTTRANSVLGQQQAESAAWNNLLNLGGAAAGGAYLGSTGALGPNVTGGQGAVAALLSDERLKENITPIGMIGKLPLYSWTWKPEVIEALGDGLMNIGFIAQEVEEIAPEYVFEVDGLKVVNYPALLRA